MPESGIHSLTLKLQTSKCWEVAASLLSRKSLQGKRAAPRPLVGAAAAEPMSSPDGHGEAALNAAPQLRVQKPCLSHTAREPVKLYS